MTGCGQEQRYPSGRDTVKSFGNGRYQVLHLPDDLEVLYDLQKQEDVVRSPLSWETRGNLAQITGNKGSIKVRIQIDLRNNQIEELKTKQSQPER